LPQVLLNTPVDDDSRSCAIANFGIKNYTPQQLADKLLADYKIFTVAIDHPFIKGVRVTPHLYNSPEDIDKLIEAIKSL
jgi:selenocysteine lyase/cysteine desulfurase